jgi:hypothetical protein
MAGVSRENGGLPGYPGFGDFGDHASSGHTPAVSASDDGRAGAALQSQVDALERQHTIDLGVIADLQAEGVVDRGMIANLEIALGGARRIGAAIGILMVTRKISDEQAYELMPAAELELIRA